MLWSPRFHWLCWPGEFCRGLFPETCATTHSGKTSSVMVHEQEITAPYIRLTARITTRSGLFFCPILPATSPPVPSPESGQHPTYPAPSISPFVSRQL
ncbi:hypothetical protein CKO_01907 [Citrobacter koseri ATCC BAA-895]|uniref:Uncharacterized protein n=1 Tax=Citrobacter koseri (strain ATCC BAA-895 / CDC 4225-83 / SGSC4696) TaxID=290338 RepID=A8AHS1_CITK8|nr:hypothetical protein CKO_01907 [Citrobacter koseri ATCC BAA-895]